MIHPDPKQRPMATELLALQIVCPTIQKSKVNSSQHVCAYCFGVQNILSAFIFKVCLHPSSLDYCQCTVAVFIWM